MGITYHGQFNTYSPVPNPEKPFTMIRAAVFSRNKEGEDFYDIRDAIPDDALVVLVDDGNLVRGASKGDLMAIPQFGQKMYSIRPAPEDVTPELAQGKVLDPEAGTLT